MLLEGRWCIGKLDGVWMFLQLYFRRTVWDAHGNFLCLLMIN